MVTKKEIQAAFKELVAAQGKIVRLTALPKGTPCEYAEENLGFISGLVDATTGVLIHLRDAITNLK